MRSKRCVCRQEGMFNESIRRCWRAQEGTSREEQRSARSSGMCEGAPEGEPFANQTPCMKAQCKAVWSRVRLGERYAIR